MSEIPTEHLQLQKIRASLEKLSYDSLTVFDADINFGEALRLIQYKGELYVFISPLGQIWKFDGANWVKAYDVGEKVGRIPVNPSNVYSKWSMTSWDACHFSYDDKLYFVGVYFPTNKACIVRYTKSTDTWEFIDLSATLGVYEIFQICEFNDYLYIGVENGTIWRSQDGVTWANVFTVTPGDPVRFHALEGNEGVGFLLAGTNSEENGLAITSTGKLYKSANGTVWTEILSSPNSRGGISAISIFGSAGDYAVVGTNLGWVWLWDGGYQAGRWVGRVDDPILEIKYVSSVSGVHRYWELLLICGNRSSSGSMWVLQNGRLLPIYRSQSKALFSTEKYIGKRFFSWGWEQQIASTHVRGHYAGVAKLTEEEFLMLSQGKTQPFDDYGYWTTTNAETFVYEINARNYDKKVFKIENGGSNSLNYRVYGSINGIDYTNYGDGTITAGNQSDFDWSTKLFAVLRFAVWSTTPDLSTTARIKIEFSGGSGGMIRLLTVLDVISVVKSGTWNIDNLLNPHPVSLPELGTVTHISHSATTDLITPATGKAIKVRGFFFYTDADIEARLNFKTSGNTIGGLKSKGVVAMNLLGVKKPQGAVNEIVQLTIVGTGNVRGWVSSEEV